MSDDDFLGAVRDAPDDDLPRLAYADWLQERGNPRGEFIRVQCELARLAEADPRRPDLEVRERELLDAHEPEWLALLPAPFAKYFIGQSWDRGFVEPGSLGMDEFLTHGEGLFAATPLRKLSIYLGCDYRPSDLPRFAARAELGRLAELSLCNGPVGDRGVQSLAASPHLGNLMKLSLSYCRVSPTGAAALAGSSRFKNLRKLGLGSSELDDSEATANAVGAEGVRALGWSPHLPRLQELDLSGNRLSVVAVRTLAASPLMGRLTDLHLGSHGIYGSGMKGLMGLAQSPAAARLQTLDLSGCYLGATELRALAASPRLSRLQRLNLAEVGFGQGALESFWAALDLPSLTTLHLGHSIDEWSTNGQWGGGGLDLLLASPQLDRLTDLGLADVGVGPDGARALADSPRIGNLRKLDLGYNPIGDAGLLSFARSPHASNLEELRASGCGIGPEGVRALLGETQFVARLRRLDLSANRLGDGVARLLANSPGTGKLRELDLGSAGIGDGGAAALAASPYLNDIRRLNLTSSSSEDRMGIDAFRQLRARWGRWFHAWGPTE